MDMELVLLVVVIGRTLIDVDIEELIEGSVDVLALGVLEFEMMISRVCVPDNVLVTERVGSGDLVLTFTQIVLVCFTFHSGCYFVKCRWLLHNILSLSFRILKKTKSFWFPLVDYQPRG